VHPYTRSGLVKIQVDTIDSQMEGKKFTFLRCYSMSPCMAIITSRNLAPTGANAD